jgi:hypothetical protein
MSELKLRPPKTVQRTSDSGHSEGAEKGPHRPACAKATAGRPAFPIDGPDKTRRDAKSAHRDTQSAMPWLRQAKASRPTCGRALKALQGLRRSKTAGRRPALQEPKAPGLKRRATSLRHQKAGPRNCGEPERQALRFSGMVVRGSTHARGQTAPRETEGSWPRHSDNFSSPSTTFKG